MLAVLYYSTGGDFWTLCANPEFIPPDQPITCPAASYLSAANVCLWYNTTCDGPNGNLVEIRLGTLDCNHTTSLLLFLQVNHLTHYTLSFAAEDNNLRGTIPEEISALSPLVGIDFDGNDGLTGTIPISLGDLNMLEELDLDTNKLTGSLPVQLFSATSLIRLDLDMNRLTGTIPPTIGDLQDLDTLQLDANLFTGELEPRIGDLDLLSMSFDRCIILATVYSCSNKSLFHFYLFAGFLTLNNNNFEGPIPDSFQDLRNLRAFAVQSNRLNGMIPAFFGDLVNLETINLFDNFFTGEVPTELGRLTNLVNLFVHFNPLSGSMPAEVCALRDGNLRQLVADCGPGGTIQCQQPECCTACFVRPSSAQASN